MDRTGEHPPGCTNAITVYLIGCDHLKEQTYRLSTGPDHKHSEFRKVLREAVGNHIPDLIAEEYHPALLQSQKRQSIALEVASEMRICHRFCDLSQDERNERGIGVQIPPTQTGPGTIRLRLPIGIGPISEIQWYKHNIAHRFPIREDFWIAQFRNGIHAAVIFVCGSMHVETLKERLKRLHIKAVVIADFVGFDPRLTNAEEFRAREEVRVHGFSPIATGPESKCFCIGLEIDNTADDQNLE